jgi:hypothetical protein
LSGWNYSKTSTVVRIVKYQLMLLENQWMAVSQTVNWKTCKKGEMIGPGTGLGPA